MLCRAERGQQGRAEKCRCGPRGCGCGLHRDPAESHAEEKVEQLVSGRSGSLDLVVPRLEVEDLAHCTHAAAEGAPSCVCVCTEPRRRRDLPRLVSLVSLGLPLYVVVYPYKSLVSAPTLLV